MDRKRKTFTEPVKFAVITGGKVIEVFAHCEYEAVGIVTKDPNLNEYYPSWFDGYVYACNSDEADIHEDPDTFNGCKHLDDFTHPVSWEGSW